MKTLQETDECVFVQDEQGRVACKKKAAEPIPEEPKEKPKEEKSKKKKNKK
jgi:hypothetical protein